MRLLVASEIDRGALATLRAQHDVVTAIAAPEEELYRAIVDREVIIFRSGVSISRRVLEAGASLRLLVRAGSGLDNLDLEYVRGRGIVLERIAGPGAQSVAELTFGLMLALARKILVADRLWRDGHWVKSEMTGHLLTGKTLGIIGLGNIGTHVARLGAAWGMHVIGCVDRPSPERAAAFAAAGYDLRPDCDEVLAAGDFVTVHVPLSDATRGLIDARAIGLMKRGAFLLNLARGGIVDEAALLDDLVAGDHLAGAALDVHANEGEGKLSPLRDLPNAVLTPHIGASTVDSQRQIGEEIVRIIGRFGHPEQVWSRPRSNHPSTRASLGKPLEEGEPHDGGR